MTFVRRNIGYIILALAVSALMLAVAILLPNSKLLTLLWASEGVSVHGKLSVTLSLLGSLVTNF